MRPIRSLEQIVSEFQKSKELAEKLPNLIGDLQHQASHLQKEVNQWESKRSTLSPRLLRLQESVCCRLYYFFKSLL